MLVTNKSSKKKKKNRKSTQQLIGIKSFSRNGLQTNGHGELVFYLINPTNISVLSQNSVSEKIRRLMQLLTAQPDIEICCIDDQECFDDNKNYLRSRIKEETNSKIRTLLDYDLKFLDSIQLQMSTARQFMFIIRLKNESEEQSFSNLNRIEKVINEQGFNVKKAVKRDIKRILSVYFGGVVMSDEIPDTDGDLIIEKWLIPD